MTSLDEFIEFDPARLELGSRTDGSDHVRLRAGERRGLETGTRACLLPGPCDSHEDSSEVEAHRLDHRT
jgi:hypothetical protein